MSLPSVSRHLKVLENAGLVSKTRSAQWRPCRLEAKPLRAADAWLASYRKFFDTDFDRVEDQLEQMVADQDASVPTPARQRTPDVKTPKKARAKGNARTGRSQKPTTRKEAIMTDASVTERVSH
jgi:hypothetical protein